MSIYAESYLNAEFQTPDTEGALRVILSSPELGGSEQDGDDVWDWDMSLTLPDLNQKFPYVRIDVTEMGFSAGVNLTCWNDNNCRWDDVVRMKAALGTWANRVLLRLPNVTLKSFNISTKLE